MPSCRNGPAAHKSVMKTLAKPEFSTVLFVPGEAGGGRAAGFGCGQSGGVRVDLPRIVHTSGVPEIAENAFQRPLPVVAARIR